MAMDKCIQRGTLGRKIRFVPLSVETTPALGGSSIVKLDPLFDVPAGKTRHLLYIDHNFRGTFDPSAGETIAVQRLFNLWRNFVLRSKLGANYDSITGRQVRLAYYLRRGRFAGLEPAPVPDGGAVVRDLFVRQMFADPTTKGADRAVNVSLLSTQMAVRWGTSQEIQDGAAAGLAMVVTEYTVTAIVEDSYDEGSGPFVQHTTTPSGTRAVSLPEGDYILAAIEDPGSGEALNLNAGGDVELLSVPGISYLPISAHTVYKDWIANLVRPSATEAAEYAVCRALPVLSIDGDAGSQSEAGAVGDVSPFAYRIETGTLATPENLIVYRNPDGRAQRERIQRIATGRALDGTDGYFVKPKTRSGKPLDLDAPEAIAFRWKNVPVNKASKIKALRK